MEAMNIMNAFQSAKDLPNPTAVPTPPKGEAWCGPVPAMTPLLAKNQVTARIKVQ